MLCNFFLYVNNIQKYYSVSRCVISIIIVFALTLGKNSAWLNFQSRVVLWIPLPYQLLSQYFLVPSNSRLTQFYPRYDLIEKQRKIRNIISLTRTIHNSSKKKKKKMVPKDHFQHLLISINHCAKPSPTLFYLFCHA